MFNNSISFIVLVAIFYLPTIFTLEMDEDEMEGFRIKLLNGAYKACHHLISNETLEMMHDGSDVDNDETHEYIACMFEDLKWFVDMKIMPDQIIKDVAAMRSKATSPPEIAAAKIILNLCKSESERFDTKVEVVYRFGKCISDRCRTEL